MPFWNETAAADFAANRAHRDMGLWQEQCERAPLPQRTSQPDFTAEQPGNFAADRQTEPGAAVFPAGAAIGLLEGFKNNLLFFWRDADAGIADGEGDNRAGMV